MTAIKAREGALEAAAALYAGSVSGYVENGQIKTSAIATALSTLSTDLGQYLQAASALGKTKGEEGLLEDVLLNIQAVSQGLDSAGQAFNGVVPQQALAVLKDAFKAAGKFVEDALTQWNQLVPAIQRDGNGTTHLDAFMSDKLGSTFEDFSKQVSGLNGKALDVNEASTSGVDLNAIADAPLNENEASTSTQGSEKDVETAVPASVDKLPDANGGHSAYTSKTMDEIGKKLQHLAKQHPSDARINQANTIFSELKSNREQLSKECSKLGKKDIERLEKELVASCSDVAGASELIFELFEHKTV